MGLIAELRSFDGLSNFDIHESGPSHTHADITSFSPTRLPRDRFTTSSFFFLFCFRILITNVFSSSATNSLRLTTCSIFFFSFVFISLLFLSFSRLLLSFSFYISLYVLSLCNPISPSRRLRFLFSFLPFRVLATLFVCHYIRSTLTHISRSNIITDVQYRFLSLLCLSSFIPS